MSRRISEKRMCNEHAHKEMKAPLFAGGVDPQLEQAGWFMCDHSRTNLLGRQQRFLSTQIDNQTGQIRILRAVQSMSLQKRHLETVDLYEPPLDMFGADAVERWFTEKEVSEFVNFTQKLAI